MHSQDRIFNGHAISTAHLKPFCIQVLLVAFAFLFSWQTYAQCPPDNLIIADLNHSLSPDNCESVLTVDDVKGNNDIDACDCEVTILDEHDNELPPMFDFDDIDQTFRYQLCCDGVCGWANITVEYKGNAQFLCPDDNTIVESSCIEMDEVIPPVAESQCVDPGVILISEIVNNVNCADNVQRQLIRTYQITGPQGPIQQFCTQTINIVSADLSNLEFPEKAVINCDQEPTTDLTGAPVFTAMINGEEVEFELTPESLPLNCSVFVSFEDTEFAIECGTQITRMWTVGQWSCDVDTVQTFPQVITVTDINPPTIVCPPAITATTTTDDCKAVINLPAAQISDDCSDDLTVSISPGNLNTNGGFAVLDTGSYQVVYSVSDCANTTRCTVDLEVLDMTPPVAICETDITIGYAGDGNTFLEAYKIDAGSFDDCGNVKFGIARMIEGLDIPDHTFEDRIEILCEDIGMPFLAILELTDSEGNVSYCMVEVTVTNKLIPTLMCPAPDTVDCDFVFDENNLSAFFNEPVIGNTQCLGGFTTQDVLLRGGRNDCGIGSVRRRLRLFDSGGVQVAECFTRVVFEAPEPFVFVPPTGICTPDNICTNMNNVCGAQPVCSVEEAQAFQFEPTLIQERCQLLGISTELIETTANPIICEITSNPINSCQQFIRRFTVIDWCTDDGPGSKADPFVFEQVINIREAIPPNVAAATELEFCVPLNDCDSLFVEIPAPTVLSDNCGEDVSIEFAVFDNASPADTLLSMESAMLSGNFDVGSYSINWVYTDACGNITRRTQVFDVKNCKAPAITCIAGLALPIIPGDNLATLEIKQVLVFAGNSCGDDTDVTVSFDDTNLVETITLSCDDIDVVDGEPVSVNIFATDSDGNQSKCTTLISLSDNGLCPDNNFTSGNNEMRVSVSGNVITPINTNINGAEVALVGSSNTISTSTEDGNYMFGDMPTGASYVVRPSFDGDVLNGISIIDMILIQQHILNINPITNPYLLLAADVNGSGDVSIADVILLQRVSLRLTDLPSNVPNWKFVNADVEFFDMTNPFSTVFSSEKVIENLQGDEVYNFIGIKAGDVNGNVLMETENRSNASVHLKVENTSFDEGKMIVPFNVSETLSSVKGISIEMNTSDLNVLDLLSSELKDGTFSMDVTAGKLKFISVNEDDLYINADVPLFELVFEGNSYTTLKEVLKDAKVVLVTEANGELIEQNIEVKLEAEIGQEFINVIPNPWKDMTTIEISANEKALGSLFITDLSGNVVHRNTIPLIKGTNTLELSSEIIHIPGVYFIHVNTPTSRQSVKMIKLE